MTFPSVAVLGRNIWVLPGPHQVIKYGRQQRLREITIEPVKNWGLGKIFGPMPPDPSLKPALLSVRLCLISCVVVRSSSLVLNHKKKHSYMCIDSSEMSDGQSVEFIC